MIEEKILAYSQYSTTGEVKFLLISSGVILSFLTRSKSSMQLGVFHELLQDCQGNSALKDWNK